MCWREERAAPRKTDREVAQDYMRFFEPDVLVEAEPGLAASIGYGALARDRYHSQLLDLDSLFSSNSESRPWFQFGLSVRDAYADIFQSQRQFDLRDATPAFVFNETNLSRLVEAIFGAFPTEERAQRFSDAYKEVYRPKVVDPVVEHWFKYFREGATTPFVPTQHKIEIEPRGTGDLSFFIFDHTKAADLIDYWNKRLFVSSVHPVPLCWLPEIAPTMVDMITRNHQPIPNNPFGTKFQSVVYFGRSLRRDKIADLFREYLADCPDGSRRPGGVWHPTVTTDRHGPSSERHSVKVDDRSFDAEIIEGNTVQLDTLAPDFAERYGGGHQRWANVIKFSSYRDDTWALTYPSNLEDRSTPRISRRLQARPVVTREGWVFAQEFKRGKAHLELSDGPSAIAEWLERRAIKAELSGAGRVAKQMIEGLGSLWATHLIAHKKIIELLNSMAAQEIVRGEADEATRRQFEGRTVIVGRWKTLINQLGKDRLPRLSLDDFTERGILKLGLGVECPNCTHSNWYGLDRVDYEVTCERCLKLFKFPQGEGNTHWKYRVTGPFSVPNFAEGAYAVALTLNVFNMKLEGGGDTDMTYATGLTLTHKNFDREIDFAFWHSERPILRQRQEPRFVFGEAKSFAKEAIAERDIETLKHVSQVVPGAIVVVAVLKMEYSETEKALLTELTEWGWKPVNGRPRAQVMLLTGVELFADFRVGTAWDEAGAPYPNDADHWVFGDLDELARTTQKIHLGLDYYKSFKEQAANKK